MSAGWWSDAVTYQVYLRSFADSDGDGIGDLPGLASRLDYLQALGVDSLWLNPCYASPQRDHGYDIADYFRVDPAYGTNDDLRSLLEDAHARGIRVLMDMVANHCSTEHAWFRAALEAGPGSAERARFLFRAGRGEHGELPPNNWESVFGGPAWTRVPDGEWYFHAFDSSQPDFDWRNPDVAQYFDSVMEYWFDLGVDGFRIDVAHGLVKDAALADWTEPGHNYAMWDQPETHDVYRRWRDIGERYDPPRYFVGEIWVPSLESMSRYLAPDELHQAFSFDLLVQPWHADRMRAAIDRALAQSTAVGGPPAWTLSNHDVHRTSTRYGQQQDLAAPLPTDMIAAARRRGPADLALGVRRAQAAAMLQLALPGAVFLYQGEELGLPEVLDLPDTARQDPIWSRSGGAELGRDGCRVPLPWSIEGDSFGFGPDGASEPWLPQPSWFGDFAADQQAGSVGSTLELYRSLLAQRRRVFGSDATLTWIPTGAADVLAFRRGSGVCVVNFSDREVVLPGWGGASVASEKTDIVDGALVVPSNSAAWIDAARVPAGSVGPDAAGVDSDPSLPQLEPTAP
ncbi:glycoside hydrolase family 13 protein [Schumannella luteola]